MDIGITDDVFEIMFNLYKKLDIRTQEEKDNSIIFSREFELELPNFEDYIKEKLNGNTFNEQ